MKLINACIIFAVLSFIVYADCPAPGCSTVATVTITNRNGVVVSGAPMVCNFVNYVLGYSDLQPDGSYRCNGMSSSVSGDPYPVGPHGEITQGLGGNMSNFSCNFSFTKLYTVNETWNASVQFTHWGTNPHSDYIAVQEDSEQYPDSYPYSWAGACTGPDYCWVDRNWSCYTGLPESINFVLYTINYDQNKDDCLGNLSMWFSRVNETVVPPDCTTTACCCGDDHIDNFFFYNQTNDTCFFCNNGNGGSKDNSTKRCSQSQCSSKSGGWNNTVCTTLNAWSEPASDGSSYCYGTPITFKCNYTDGDGGSIGIDQNGQGAAVFIYVDGVPYNNAGMSGVGYTGHDVNYSTDGYYYFTTSNLGEGATHIWNCSASKPGYAPGFNGTYSIGISPSQHVLASMWATPDVSYLGDMVTINVSYKNESSLAPIADADCELMINTDPYNLLPATYDPASQTYNVTTNQLMPGPNDLDYSCNEICFQTGTAHNLHYVRWSGELNFPAIVLEDPTYSVNSGGVYHKIVKRAPLDLSSKLVNDIGFGNSAYNWTYGMVVKPANVTPLCSDINKMVDSSKILLVSNSTKIANATLCPNIIAFSGVIFEDDACVKNASCQSAFLSQKVPFIFNFTYNATYPTSIYTLPNLTYILLNGEQHVVEDVSKLRTFYFNGYYVASTQAPSFLMRLYGQFDPSPYGIYSFVDINQYNLSRSSVDYYYFNSTNKPMYLIKGMPNCENISVCNSNVGHFQLDNEVSIFNASNAYTHITNIGADKLPVNPPGVECIYDTDCQNKPISISCTPATWCITSGAGTGSACNWPSPTASCNNRYCQNSKCTSCTPSCGTAQCTFCPSVAPVSSKYCSVSSGTCVTCSGYPNWQSCISPYTSCTNVMDADVSHCGSCNSCPNGGIGYACSSGTCIQTSFCGNGICEAGENYVTCWQDCCSSYTPCTGVPTGGNRATSSDNVCHSACANHYGCGASVNSNCESYTEGPGTTECISGSLTVYGPCCGTTQSGTCATTGKKCCPGGCGCMTSCALCQQ